MCGIIGLVNSDPKSHVNQALVDALTILQHRGQDAAGIVTVSNNRFNLRKDRGTVAEVFTQDNVVSLRGNIGIGHVRYPTAGGSKSSEAQPLYSNFPFGIAIAHNGNLTNTEELISKMKNSYRHVNTDSDSEVLLNVFADELQRRQMSNITPDDIFDSVRIVMRKCKGAYAVVILINRLGLLAFRDPNGIRPLCFGTRQTSTGIDYAVASESVAIDALDPSFQLQRDVKGGEAIFISNRGELFSKNFHTVTKFAPCIFEYVYFARPDSILDGVQVYEARSMMGEKLAKKILMLHPEHDIDIVMPIPETSRTSALQCAHVLGRPYREGFIKNRYIARTFIMPGQEMRRKTVRLKLNTIKSEFRGKTVLLFDDSIVRGTTSMELVQMARDAGAKKVYFASAAPPVRFSNVYGIDIPTRGELVAHNRSVVDIQEFLGADMVIYNDLEDIISAVRDLNPTRLQDFECSCFDGRYVTPEVTPEYLLNLEQKRGAGRFGARVAGSPSPSYGLHSTTSGSGPIVGPNGNNNSNTTTVTTATTTANHNHHAACAGEADGLPTATLVAPMSPGPCKEDIPKERTPAGGVFAGQTLSGSGSHSSLLTVTGELELNSVSARSTGGGGGGGGGDNSTTSSVSNSTREVEDASSSNLGDNSTPLLTSGNGSGSDKFHAAAPADASSAVTTGASSSSSSFSSSSSTTAAPKPLRFDAHPISAVLLHPAIVNPRGDELLLDAEAPSDDEYDCRSAGSNPSSLDSGTPKLEGQPQHQYGHHVSLLHDQQPPPTSHSPNPKTNIFSRRIHGDASAGAGICEPLFNEA